VSRLIAAQLSAHPIYQRPGAFARAFAFIGVFMVTMRGGSGQVRVKKARQFKNLEPRFDSIETEKALDYARIAEIERFHA
jgi:hypothetical protein